ncbi:D-tyrosyl-tRNA(Tyr) deacylase [Hydrogenophaga crassostreae]|uniref:D-aminoacyl-tRNA deacylase n=1 Tax=Hydrogenophaga crassostreae TaxID=1763535 RepID=A0A167GKX0_9BURK|nr:D-aminoacyl-tRNA deacylase [Hydrogenophaga crassostreae]AOW14768.1 D-tyrosyl-tRNA(Tyr) deacylase [Hydrogenophaga crassostreae]OAD39595.1 D-tyrosyl-tRNA(Tyr) deacylase [Hydrogenophaga crassostreae]
MIAVLQRVSEARVEVAGSVVGSIGVGLLVLFCAEPEDTEALAQKMLSKILKLRIFGDSEGKMNLSLQEVGGGLLLVSQFTLAADTRSGNRPGFTGAASPVLGEALFDRFVALARAQHPVVETGRFATEMKVHLVNDGPVTIPLRMN